MSGNWVTAASALPGYQRIYLLKAEVIDEGTQYDFRVFAFAGNSFSNAAYVSKRFLIGTSCHGSCFASPIWNKLTVKCLVGGCVR